MPAKDGVAGAVGDELAEAVWPAVGDRTHQVVVVGQSGNGVVGPRGFGLGQADPAIFGIGEAATGHNVVRRLPGGSQDGVPGGDAALHPRALHQHRMAVNVTDGEDVPDVGAQVLVDGNRAGPGAAAGPVPSPPRCSMRTSPPRRARDSTIVPVAMVMPRARKARPSPSDTLGSAAGTRTGPASYTVTAAPRSARTDAIWQPVSAPPITATRRGRLASDGMSS